MILKYVYGNPLDTEAAVLPVEYGTGRVPYFKEQEGLEEAFCIFTYTMSPEDKIWGLGEQVRGINKRGWIYESNNMDDPEHTEGKHSLYGAHNFFIVDGRETFGVFFDYPAAMTFDFGYTRKSQIRITIPEGDFTVYIITPEKVESAPGQTQVLTIVKQFRRMIGRSYIPPRWAFGYQQSRWGYEKEEDIYETAALHKKHGIPLSAIYLDIDYMEGFKDFTIDRKRFPHMEKMMEDLNSQGIKVVPIIDAGVKIEPGYSFYKEGIEKGYFCRKEDGSYFTGGVWPGRVHFPDVLHEEAREWFGNGYESLIAMGAGGFWNDMNEPALFYSEEGLQRVYKKAGEMDSSTLLLDDFLELQPLMNEIANNAEDYKCFYHNFKGKRVRHDKVHNLYGYYMTRAAFEAMERFSRGKRMLLFSRSSYIGMHRYGGIWTGDNKSWWSHLLLNVKMMPSLNMCGFLYCGGDIGGFGDDVTEDLMLRWLEFGIFVPLMRNHSALGTRRQELYQFECVDAMRELICLRYRLLPYLYSEFMKAALNDDMYFKPLSFVYEKDEQAAQTEDQLLAGDSIMIAPVVMQNQTGRYVYLPEDMLLVTFSKADQFALKPMEKGHHYVNVLEHEVILFVRKNCILPLGPSSNQTGDVKLEEMELIFRPGEEAAYTYYTDDGFSASFDIEKKTVSIDKQGGVRYRAKKCTDRS